MKKSNNLFLFILLIFLSVVFCVLSFFPIPFPSTSKTETNLSTIGYIYDDCKITQEFVSEMDELYSVEIVYASFHKTFDHGILHIEIYDYDNNKIYDSDVEISKLVDNQSILMNFNTVKSAYNKTFKMIIEVKDSNFETPFTFYGYKDTDNKMLFFNEQKKSKNDINGELYISYKGTHRLHAYTIIVLIIIIIVICILMNKYKIQLKKVKISNIIVFIVCSIISFVCAFCYLFYHYYEMANLLLSSSFFLVFGLTSMINTIVVNYILIANRKIEVIFVVCAIIIGSFYFVLFPQGNAPDEAYHYRQVNKLASLDFRLTSVTYESEIYDGIGSYKELIQKTLHNQSNNSVVNKNGHVGYSLLLYIPSSIGLLVGKILHFNVYFSYYLATYCNFIFYIIIGYFIIKIIPFGKKCMFVYLLNPMSLELATSVSVDVVINCSCLLFMALVLSLKDNGKELSIKNVLLLMILSILVFVSKFAYFPIILLLLLIKDKLFRFFDKNKTLVISLIMLSFIICGALFYYHRLMPYVPDTIESTGYKIISNTSIIPEGAWVLSNPLRYLGIIINTLVGNLNFYVMSFAGKSLAQLNLNIPDYVVITFYALLLLAMLSDKYDKLSAKNKILLLFIWIVNFILITFGFITAEGTIRDIVIVGIQGRYFIPINFLLLILLIKPKVRLKNDSVNIWIVSLFIIHFIAFSYIVQFFL